MNNWIFNKIPGNTFSSENIERIKKVIVTSGENTKHSLVEDVKGKINSTALDQAIRVLQTKSVLCLK